MNDLLKTFAQQLRHARITKNLSQRDLSKLTGVPQSHISKIESNQVDLRLSSFIALANALGLELALVPRMAMPAVRSLSGQASSTTPAKPSSVTEEMRKLREKLRQLQIDLPPRPELDAARKAYAALKPLRLDSNALEQIRRITQTLGRDAEPWTAITEATRKLEALRNRLAHIPSPQGPIAEAKPAYSLDDEEE